MLTSPKDEFLKGFGWNSQSTYSRKSYTNHLATFENFLHRRSKQLTDGTVNDGDIQDYIAYLWEEKGYQRNTVAAKISVISSCYKWMARHNKLTNCPKVSPVKQEKVVHQEVSDNSLAVLFSHLDVGGEKQKRDSAILALVALAGFTTEEAMAINVEDISFSNLTVKVNKIARKVPMEVVAKLARYHQNKTHKSIEGPFFLNKDGYRISSRSFRRHLQLYCSKLGFSFSTRDLLHSYTQKHKSQKT